MPRTIFAFNGDLESRLALHWLVHDRGLEVLALSINLGQEVYLEPLGELAPVERLLQMLRFQLQNFSWEPITPASSQNHCWPPRWVIWSLFIMN